MHQLDFIGSFFQAKVKNMVFVKLDSTYADYFPEYSKYFGRALRLLKSMYGMTKYGKLFADELKIGYFRHTSFNLNVRCLFIISMHHMEQFFVLYYADGCVYWYTYEAIGIWFVYDLGNILYVNFLVYENWLM